MVRQAHHERLNLELSRLKWEAEDLKQEIPLRQRQNLSRFAD